MKLKCPVCGEVLEVDVDLVEGKKVRCAFCGRIFVFKTDCAVEYHGRAVQPVQYESGRIIEFGRIVKCVLTIAALVVFAVVFGVWLSTTLHSLSWHSVQEDQGELDQNDGALGNVRRSNSRDNELGLIWNERGLVSGAMGHQLGETKSQMVDTGGRWEEGLLGRRYLRRLSPKVLNFSELRLEYCQDNPYLWGIHFMAYAGSHRSRGEVNSFIKQLRDRISEENGLDLRLERKSGEFDTYSKQGATVKGFTSFVRLSAIERDAGGYVIWLSVGCFDLQRLTY